MCCYGLVWFGRRQVDCERVTGYMTDLDTRDVSGVVFPAGTPHHTHSFASMPKHRGAMVDRSTVLCVSDVFVTLQLQQRTTTASSRCPEGPGPARDRDLAAPLAPARMQIVIVRPIQKRLRDRQLWRRRRAAPAADACSVCVDWSTAMGVCLVPCRPL